MRFLSGIIGLAALWLFSCSDAPRTHQQYAPSTVKEAKENKGNKGLRADWEMDYDSLFFRYPYRIEIKDSLAVLLDLHNDTHYGYAFTYPDWKPIAPFGKRGEGPEELLSADQIRIRSLDSVYVLDANRMQITRWSVSIPEKKITREEVISLDKRLLRTLDFCLNGPNFLVTDYTGKHRFHEIGRDGKIIRSVGNIPTEHKEALENAPALAQAWRTFMSYNPKNGVLALVTQLGEVIEVYNLKNGFHKVVFGPNGEPVFSAQGSEAIPKGIKGFNDVFVADSCIYATFDGVTFKEKMQQEVFMNGGRWVYVFDLEGKLIKTILLEQTAQGIYVDKRTNSLYTTCSDGDYPVIRYPAP